jgi:hypothetical protein
MRPQTTIKVGDHPVVLAVSTVVIAATPRLPIRKRENIISKSSKIHFLKPYLGDYNISIYDI